MAICAAVPALSMTSPIRTRSPDTVTSARSTGAAMTSLRTCADAAAGSAASSAVASKTERNTSSLRTQGPITPGLKSEKRPLLECRSESPRRMGPCVRRDDLLENSICDSPAASGERSERRDDENSQMRQIVRECGYFLFAQGIGDLL